MKSFLFLPALLLLCTALSAQTNTFSLTIGTGGLPPTGTPPNTSPATSATVTFGNTQISVTVHYQNGTQTTTAYGKTAPGKYKKTGDGEFRFKISGGNVLWSYFPDGSSTTYHGQLSLIRNTSDCADQAVQEESVVTLPLEADDLPEGHEILSYSWSQVSGTTVTLDDATAKTPSFTAPNLVADETLVFTVDITDVTQSSVIETVTTTVTILANDDAPEATYAGELAGTAGSTVQLVMSATDPEGGTLSYQWSHISGTTGSFDDDTSEAPTFQLSATPSGPAELKCEISDGTNTTTVFVTIEVL